jgi:hypothetical protein
MLFTFALVKRTGGYASTNNSPGQSSGLTACASDGTARRVTVSYARQVVDGEMKINS